MICYDVISHFAKSNILPLLLWDIWSAYKALQVSALHIKKKAAAFFFFFLNMMFWTLTWFCRKFKISMVFYWDVVAEIRLLHYTGRLIYFLKGFIGSHERSLAVPLSPAAYSLKPQIRFNRFCIIKKVLWLYARLKCKDTIPNIRIY